MADRDPPGEDAAEALVRALFQTLLGRPPGPGRQLGLAKRIRAGGAAATLTILEELAARPVVRARLGGLAVAPDPLAAEPALAARAAALAERRDARLAEVEEALAALAATGRLRPDQVAYGQDHRHRLAEAAQAIAALLGTAPDWPACPVLEIGSSITPLLYRALFPELRLHSLDLFDHPQLAGVVERQFRVDLEKADLRAPAPLPPRGMALILLAEVLEHLLVHPANLFRALAASLRPGGLLYVSTPNFLRRPVQDLLAQGRNPNAMLPAHLGPEDRFHHHVREYTMAELLPALAEAGLEPVAAGYSDTEDEPARWADRSRDRWPVLVLVGRRPG
jgi:SAM-dependent methyltransferase